MCGETGGIQRWERVVVDDGRIGRGVKREYDRKYFRNVFKNTKQFEEGEGEIGLSFETIGKTALGGKDR